MSTNRTPAAAAPAPRAGRSPWLWFLAPLLLTLAFQIVYACLDRAPDVDEASYLDLGRSILRHEGKVIGTDYPPRPCLIHPPLFYYLVALSFSLFGPGLVAGRIVSSVMSVGTLALVFAILRRERGERWAAAGTLLAAVNPAFLYYGHSVYMEMTAAFLMTCALWAFRHVGEVEDLRWELRAGIFLGLACVTKYYSGVLVLVMTAAVLADRGRGRAGRMRRILALLGPVALAGLAWLALGIGLAGVGGFLVNFARWTVPSQPGPSFSWRDVSNLTFLREIVGVVTPAFALVALLGVAAAAMRSLRSREGRMKWAFWVFPIAFFLLFLMIFREKDVKYVVPLIPVLSILAALAPPREWMWRLPARARITGALVLCVLASPLLPLYDPVTGQTHDNLWVFGIKRDGEYRLYRDAGVAAGRESSPGQVIVCQRKGAIIAYYADRSFLELWGQPPEEFRKKLPLAEIVVLDRNTEYLSREDWDAERASLGTEFRRVAVLPGPGNPILEIFRRSPQEQRAP